MSERPLLFSGEMVRAILAGQKTQTRRILKPQPDQPLQPMREILTGEVYWGHSLGFGPSAGTLEYRSGQTRELAVERVKSWRCPHGRPGEKLWVREKARVLDIEMRDGDVFLRLRYEADGTESDWLPYPERLTGNLITGRCLAYGCYREASRLTLELTAVRVERLQAITEEGAQAEGVNLLPCTYTPGACKSNSCPRHGVLDPCRRAYRKLWDELNAGRGYGWDTSPFVWVLEFRRID